MPKKEKNNHQLISPSKAVSKKHVILHYHFALEKRQNFAMEKVQYDVFYTGVCPRAEQKAVRGSQLAVADDKVSFTKHLEVTTFSSHSQLISIDQIPEMCRCLGTRALLLAIGVIFKSMSHLCFRELKALILAYLAWATLASVI